MKVAIIHEWFYDYSGSEKVLEQILNLFPEADLFAIVDVLPDNLRHFIKNKPVNTSFIQKLPFAKKRFRQYFPLMSFAVEQFNLSQYELIISNHHCVAKNVITGPNQLHISYVHSPIRYAWDLQHQYLKESNLDRGIKSMLVKYMLHNARKNDLRGINGVDKYFCNSEFIARRIWKYYKRNAKVIYPPVEVDKFTLEESKEDYYLTASRMVPYKRIDMIVEAFSKMPKKKLIVIGDGPEYEKIKNKATKNIEILGYMKTEDLIKYMQKAKAFVFAAEEDFGITPVEAQACGTPVIAYGKGGSLETIVENETGVLFNKQTPEDIILAVTRFEELQIKFNCKKIRNNAEKFNTTQFQKIFKRSIDELCDDFFNKKLLIK